jgi:predicted HD phosphohydrolase
MADTWPSATFTQLKGVTEDQFAPLRPWTDQFASGLPDRLLHNLEGLAGDFGGFPIDRLQHSLQTATLALRDGRDEEYVVCALVHDIGDHMASYNHAHLAGVVVEPFVSEANHWMVKNHAPFQGYHYVHFNGGDRFAMERFRDHPHFQHTFDFVDRYDQAAFDAASDTLPLETFAPMVRRVFAKPRADFRQRPAY